MAGSEPGTYVLVMRLNKECDVQVGRLGQFRFATGWYLYVGSALGPGGLRARVARHARAEKRRHWHIDYLLARADLCAVWVTEGPERRECEWARALVALPDAWIPAPRFGASDCRCPAHLIVATERPTQEALARWLGARLDDARRPIPF